MPSTGPQNILIILGGIPPSASLLKSKLKTADLIIAADSGIKPLLGIEQWPDILTGDFDSITLPDSPPSRCQVIHAPEQDASDFQKALRYLPTTGIEQLIILGGTGLRSDHFLTNLLISAELQEEIPLSYCSDSEDIYRITPKCSFSKNISLQSTVSLVPLTQCESVNANGLKWPLTGATMGIGNQLGQSNVAMSDPVTVSIEKGCLLLILNRDEKKSEIE
jgi:thiamine pyrophosphokinase